MSAMVEIHRERSVSFDQHLIKRCVLCHAAVVLGKTLQDVTCCGLVYKLEYPEPDFVILEEQTADWSNPENPIKSVQESIDSTLNDIGYKS